METMSDVTAFVLAGGKSSRMGTDKAFLRFEGKSLLTRAIDLLSRYDRVRIVGDPLKFASYGQVVADTFPGQGPLAGIHAALRSTSTELNLVLAVDMPFVTAEFLSCLLERAAETTRAVTVPRSGGRLQPLCAVYRPDLADVAEHALRVRQNKVDALFTPELTRIIEEDEIAELAFSPSMFDNLNTAEEFQRACSAARENR